MSFTEVYSRVIWQDEEGYNQVRLTISEGFGKEYLQVRKYYLSFDGEWCATKEGISLSLELDSTKELFIGLAEILSLAESREIIEQYFGDTIREIYNR